MVDRNTLGIVSLTAAVKDVMLKKHTYCQIKVVGLVYSSLIVMKNQIT